jgi:hypothetical protein
MTWRRTLPPAVARRLRAEREGQAPMRPDDLAWSDVGPWESTGDLANAECAGCGCRGPASMIARDALCWSCWARRPPDGGQEE